MARDSAGKWVQRAGATGGGRSYRGQMPVNWYAALALIVVLGLLSVGYAIYQRRNPAAAVQPTKGTTWYAGISFDLCGSVQPALPANPNASKVGLKTTGKGVITIAPKTADEAGDNATLGQFVADYPGLTLSATTVRYPKSALLTNGQTCAKGTPDAGKSGVVQVKSWPNVEAKQGGAVPGNPGDYKLPNTSLTTVAFLPKGAEVPKPPASVELAVLRASNPPTSSTTTAPVTTPTSGSTPTTAAPTQGGTSTVAPSPTPTTAGPNAELPAPTAPAKK